MVHSSSDEDVTKSILRYLIAHPNACDSLEGVCNWWLGLHKDDDTLRAVTSALAQLVADGRIATSTGSDGTTVYRAMYSARR